MPHLFYPIDAGFFHQRIQPVLARCRRARSFAVGRSLFVELLPRVKEYHASYHGLGGPTLVEQAAQGLSYDPAIWRAVAGEVLLFAADQLPLLNLSLTGLCCLLAGSMEAGLESARPRFAPIQQVLFGSRDLLFGGSCYRPDVAGYNDLADVARLVVYLKTIDPGAWQPADLMAMKVLPDDEEQVEELEFVRQSWPDLVELYRKASEKRQIVACERE
jgi:hypothetical protein